MDIEFPFVRCFPKHNRCTDAAAGSVYYLANFVGDLEEVACSVLTDENTTIYVACGDFREKYGYIFPVGPIEIWNSKEAMLAWADKMIWFSFLIRSHENEGACWFSKDISTGSWHDYTFLPNWDERFGNSSQSFVWVLLKNRGRIWPVHIVHNQFGEGWADFWDSHKLRRGFKLVFGCERSWIFDVVVLKTNLEPMYYGWSTTTHDELQESSLMPYVADDFGTPSYLRTSCLPSIMLTKDNMMQFGYNCGSEKCIFKAKIKKLLPNSLEGNSKGSTYWFPNYVYSQAINKKVWSGRVRGCGFGPTPKSSRSTCNDFPRFNVADEEERMRDKQTIRELQDKVQSQAAEMSTLKEQMDIVMRHAGLQVFGKRFRDLFHDAGVNEIFQHMRNKWWDVPRINNQVDRSSLELFFNALNLQPLDFLLVTAFDATDVNVILFTAIELLDKLNWKGLLRNALPFPGVHMVEREWSCRTNVALNLFGN
ncbi:hypothetical protein RHSIM_Rhsim11G0033100 [Rhododendron simsii]|uniref:Uncharacterized protein n=1 Tax=Rhododendron simsii TaxID=118357 RepID=A0A834G4V8_RHOSS|nr:hypothetical protein RHSIM_Rhsim11G0033100 [Rhododendron simsii]